MSETTIPVELLTYTNMYRLAEWMDGYKRVSNNGIEDSWDPDVQVLADFCKEKGLWGTQDNWEHPIAIAWELHLCGGSRSGSPWVRSLLRRLSDVLPPVPVT